VPRSRRSRYGLVPIQAYLGNRDSSSNSHIPIRTVDMELIETAAHFSRVMIRRLGRMTGPLAGGVAATVDWIAVWHLRLLRIVQCCVVSSQTRCDRVEVRSESYRVWCEGLNSSAVASLQIAKTTFLRLSHSNIFSSPSTCRQHTSLSCSCHWRCIQNPALEVSFPSPGLWSEFSTGVPSMISFGDGGDILICGLNDSSDFATHNNSSF
jgi:hypothetical protein